MANPRVHLAARSPYDAGLSYFMDEYTGDGGYGDASRLSGYGMPGIGLGYLPPTSTNDAGTQDQSTLNSVLSTAKTIWDNWTAGAARDATREARAKLIMNFAIAGSVLGAQICYAGPDNVASNEDPYWTAAQQAIQSQRPDVWQEALTAGKYWPVGQPFDMLAQRQQMAAQLAAVGITVNQAAISQPFGTSDIPFSVTVAPGVSPPPGATGGTPGGTAPVAAPGTTPVNIAGTTNPLVLLGLIGAAIYVATRPARGA